MNKLSFKKSVLINLPWLISGAFLVGYYYWANYNYSELVNYSQADVYIKNFLLFPCLVLTIFQLHIFRKINFFKNIQIWTACFISSFYFALDSNILFFMKTATIYYTTYVLAVLFVPFLLLSQFLYWLYLLFRYFKLR